MILFVFICLQIIFTVTSDEISSKLDFDTISTDSDSKLSASIPIDPVEPSISSLPEDEAQTFEKIDVTCSSGSCNTSKVADKSDTVTTDILVHVKTSVEAGKNKSVEESPDVPIVVGYAGTAPGGIDSDTNYNFNNDPLLNIEPRVPTFPDLTRRTETQNYFVPSLNPSITPQVQLNPPAPMDSYNRKIYKYETFRSDGNQLQVPYFESTLHSHYYGENPPPQLVWYPKNTASFNPVEFRTISIPSWNYANWDSNKASEVHRQRAGTVCTCSTPERKWQASPHTWQRAGTPGQHINNKLAPLN